MVSGARAVAIGAFAFAVAGPVVAPAVAAPGMGLGLYITQEIVRQHGGSLTVTSREHYGSRFAVCLPHHAPSRKEVSADANGSIIPTA